MTSNHTRKTWLIRIGVLALALILLLTALTVQRMRTYGFWRSPVFETVPPEIPELKHPSILIFSKTNSFIHVEAIPAAEGLLQELAERNGWSVYVTQNGAVHNPSDLARFDTIIWNNVTGNVLTAGQRDAMRHYIVNGGGWIGLHGAGDSSSDWDWYINTLVGARFVAHPYPEQFQLATLHPESSDPIVSHLPQAWQRTDEWYSFEASPRLRGYNVLTTIDENTYQPDFRGKDLRMGSDHPLIWKHCPGRGRALYSALGHTAASYSEPAYISVLQKAVLWTAGLEGSDCTSASADTGDRTTAPLP